MDRNGLYKAAVDVRDPRTGAWVRKEHESTFFPAHYTEADVKQAIDEAYANRKTAPDGRWEGRTSRGLVIRGWLNASGSIATAYPKMEEP